MYERKKITNKEEDEIITGMIISTRFLQHITPLIQPSLLKNKYSELVAGWCLDFFKRYEKAPYMTIQNIFETQRNYIDEEIAEQISIYLNKLSNKFSEESDIEHYNIDYHLDEAEKYLKQRSLMDLSGKIDAFLLQEQILEAEQLIANYRRVEKIQGEGVSIFQDKDAIIEAFAENTGEELFFLPGALGKSIGPFCRDDLIAVAGPAKRGKTWWLIWIAVIASTTRLNVAFFSLEMTEKQMIRRIYQNILGETKRECQEPIDVPEFDECGDVQFRKIMKKGITSHAVLKKRKSIEKLLRGAKFKLICVPAYSMSVAQMEAHLDNMEHFDEFIPDVIVVDYADILKPEIRGDHRNQIDESWKALRALAQKRHCLVVTGTHSNRATFTRDMTQGDISEDIRKMNHVACMIGLNESEEDKRKGIMRVVTLAQRHEGSGSEVIILKCFEIGKPYLDSRFVVKNKNMEN